MVVLYGNDASSILVLSTKKLYSSFLKNVFIFQKICFKVEVFKTFKISTDCHINTRRTLKRKATLKIPSTVFRRTYALSIGYKMKPQKKKRFQVLRQKPIQISPVNLLKGETIPFYCLFD